MVEHDKVSQVEILLSEYHSNPNVTDKQGRTPLNLANDPEIMKLLLTNGALAENVYKAHSKLIGKLASERPPDNPLSIFITGDGGVGKSTMLKSMLSSKGFRARFSKAKPVTGVDEKTVGIIPYEIVTKEFGVVLCYDFAGQHEFYASHCAVLENAVQISPPIIVFLADLQESEQQIVESTIRWMTMVQNQCTNLKDRAHVIVVGSHADKVKENPRQKEDIFAPIFKKFTKLEFIAFTPMDCRFPDSDQMKEVKKHIQRSSAILRSPETVSLNAHTFYIYLLDNFKEHLAVTLQEVVQSLYLDRRGGAVHSKRTRDLLSFIPNTLPRLVEICDQLNKKGLILYLHNEFSPEKSFIVCDRVTLLSKVTGTVFAPENFRQHCSLASSTGVVPLSRFTEAFLGFDVQMLIAFMSHLEFCFEITDKEVLDCVVKVDENPDVERRYLFFPGLIRIDNPEQVWEDDPNMSYHFGWIIQTSQDTQFFDPRCLQVLILRLVFAFGLAPAARIQRDIPSLQRFCSVWKNGIFWINDDGITSHLELSENVKAFVFKMRSVALQPDCLIHRHRVMSKVLEAVTTFCPLIETVESVIDPRKVAQQHPVQQQTNLALFNIKDIASAVIAKKDVVKSMNTVLPFKCLLEFEPYAGLDKSTLQCVLSENNVSKTEKIPDAFISHFSKQVTDSRHVSMYEAILNRSQDSLTQVSHPDSPRQELIQALEKWRNETEGTYSCLRETLNKYSIFSGRNPLVSQCFLHYKRSLTWQLLTNLQDLAGVAHSEVDPCKLLESTAEDVQQESCKWL